MNQRVSSQVRRLGHWTMTLVLIVAGGAMHKAAAANSQVTLLSENASTRAIALEAVTLKAGPFSTTSAPQFGSDNRTRIVLFALNVALFPNEGVSAFTADVESLEGGQAKLYQASVEHIGAVPAYPGLMQITVRLPNGLPANVGDVLVRVNWRGAGSNRVRVAIGQNGGGPADDAGSVPTPAPATPPAAPPAATPDPFAAGTISYADAKRFLEQATFGPTEAEIARVRAMGYQAWLEEQFAKPEQPYPALPTDISSDSSVSCPTTLDATARSICLRDNYAAYQLQKFLLTRALYGDDQLRQRTAWAWHKILVVSHRDINVTHWMLYYLKMLDRNALGNYRTMLTDLTLNPAMGNYLDMVNNTNSATSPANENYAREILQLFSIGLNKLNRDGTLQRDANGNTIPTYDQNTVTGFAKVFTGWQFATQRTAGIVNYVDPMAVSNENRHDKSIKQVLDGVTLPANRTSAQDLTDALNNIFQNASLAPYLSKELIHALVTSNPSPAYVRRVVDAFENNCNGLYPSNPCNSARGDMKAVIRAILLDPEARGDVKNAPDYGRLREPVELFTNLGRIFSAKGFLSVGQSDGVVAALKGGTTYDSPTYSTNPNQTTTFNPVDLLGDQDIYRPITVFSYYPSDYETPGAPAGMLGPEYGILSTSTALKRANFVNMLVFNGIANSTNATNSTPNGTKLDFSAYTSLANNPAQLIDGLSQIMTHGTLPASVKTSITTAISAIPTTDANYQLKRTQAAAYLIASSSYYQVER